VVERTQRGIWIRIYHDVFDVVTTLGPAHLYPPGKDGYAKLVLKAERSFSEGRRVSVPKHVITKIKSLSS